MLVFLVDIDDKWKTGLFNAVDYRIGYYAPDLVLNISYVDSFIVALMKRFLLKKVNAAKDTFFCGNIEVRPVVIRRGLFAVLASKLPFLFSYLLNMESEKIRRVIDVSNVKKESVNLVAHWGSTSCIYAYFMRDHLRAYFNFYHGSDVHTEPKKNKQLLHLTLQAMHAATLNFFVSRGLLAVAKELGYKNTNYEISYNGVNKAEFVRTRVRNDPPIVGYAGNLFHVKGADLLPRIFVEIKKLMPNVKFKVAGDGNLRNRIEAEFKDEGIEVEMLGKLLPSNMPDFYAGIDLLVIPSRNEALCISAIEALMCGCNVIASNVGGVPEVVESDYLINYSDKFAQNFANKVSYVLKEKPVQYLNPCFDSSISLAAEYKTYLLLK